MRWAPWQEMRGMFDRYTRAVGRPKTVGWEALAGWDLSLDILLAEIE